MRYIIVFLLVFVSFIKVKAQNPTTNPETQKLDTLPAKAEYVNKGKIAGKKAFQRSLIFPGLGQMYNYGLVVNDVQSGAVEGKKIAQKIYIISKIAAIYTGGTLLVISYGDNRQQYKRFLTELQYRQLNNNKPDPNGGLDQYTNTSALTTAKNIYKRNSQIVLISLVGLYGVNALDAYITARLKYFNVTDNLSFKIAPSVINAPTMYGLNTPMPALKLTLKL